MNEAKSVFLKLTGAIALQGKLVKSGTVVEVDEPTARNLLHRGKAELATGPKAQDAEAGGDQGGSDLPEVRLSEDSTITMDELVKAAQIDAQLTAAKWKKLSDKEKSDYMEATVNRLRAEAEQAAEDAAKKAAE